MRKSFASRALGLLPLTLIFGSSCSLVYDLSPDQCGKTTDCVRMFGEGFVCSEGLCECPVGASCDKGTGGTGGANGGTGGDSASGGTGDTSGVGGSVGGDAGMESGGVGGASAGRGGAGGTTGGAGGTTGGTTGGTEAEGGMAGMVESCSTHAECLALHPMAPIDPYACVSGRCVRLKSDDCPVVLPIDDNNKYEMLSSTNAIIVGGFSPLSGDQPTTITRNYDLALNELHKKTAGVKPGTTDRREIVMVVCETFLEKTELKAAASHLVDDLGVPGIVATLVLDDQQYVVEEVTQPAGVFMMMPLYSNQSLIDSPDNGLIWHMLSGVNSLSVSWQPLVDMTVQHLKALGSLGASEDMKLALIKATDQDFEAGTAEYLVDNHLNYNGQNVLANDADGLFKQIEVISSYTDPLDEQTDAIMDILTFQPHVVIGSNITEALNKIIPGVEAGWDAVAGGKDRPFYLLGASIYNDPDMAGLIGDDRSALDGQVPLHQRILGLGWPAAEDPSVFAAYQLRYNSAFGQPGPFENFYDAVYYLMYGLAAAKVPLDGTAIADGVRRVITGTTEVEVGPSDDMATYVNSLSTGTSTKIKLIGAQGPPAWDPNGARLDPGSVWCLHGNGSFKPDRFRFDPTDMQLKGVGTGDCNWTFPAP